MLERLRIRNLAIVASADLELAPGLNVITGETGAGKSLLVESMNLLVGGRADSRLVREGESLAWVEGEFRLGAWAASRVRPLLEDWGAEGDGDAVIVRRELSATGKSRALVNQTALTQASLKQLGDVLADLHGQHEHQSLLRPDAGSEVLDRLGGCAFEREAYAGARDAWLGERDALRELEQRLANTSERRDLLLESARDIDALAPVPGEEESLALEAARLAHADRLRELVSRAVSLLAGDDGGVLEALGGAAHAIDQAAQLDPSLTDFKPALDDARIAAAEAAQSLEAYASGLDADPDELERIEGRREAIARLVRRHRRDLEGLIRLREELRAQLADSDDAEGALERARAALEAARVAAAAAGRALSVKRRAAARTLGTRLTRELPPLGLPHARLEFALEPDPQADAFPGSGLERVEIRFTANPGESPARLQRTASGGELSRVMLALKCALEAQDRVDVRIFDEVDSGIGGPVAQAVGERLRRLAHHGQVVCVSHLPMIAALAHRQLHVRKHVSAGRTHVSVEALDGRERVEELARMLAGNRVSDTTRRQARELISAAGVEAP